MLGRAATGLAAGAVCERTGLANPNVHSTASTRLGNAFQQRIDGILLVLTFSKWLLSRVRH